MKEKIKSLFKKIIQNWKIVLVVLFIIEVFMNMYITPNQYDDEWFISKVTDELDPDTGIIIEHSITSFVQDRYYTWSSRVIIEFLLCSVLSISKYLWVLVESLMVVLICYSIAKIFAKNKEKETAWMLVFMVLCYPYYIMSETGWASTSMNYLWPLALLLFSFIPLKKMWCKEKISIFEYPLYMVSTILACNQEQACAIAFGFYALFLIFMLVRDRKIKPFMIIETLLVVASLIFILTCPGNYIRQAEEVKQLVGYANLNVVEKFVTGFTSTFGKIIKEMDITFTLATGIIALYIVSRYKEKLYRVIALFPFLTMLIFSHFSSLLTDVFPNFRLLKLLVMQDEVILTSSNCDNLYYAFPIIFSFAFFISIGLSLLLVYKKLNENLPLLIYLAGIASRLIVAFSPTIFVSRSRTVIFLDFAMIIIAFMIWQKLVEDAKKMTDNEKEEKAIKCTTEIIKVVAFLQVINNILYIYADRDI